MEKPVTVVPMVSSEETADHNVPYAIPLQRASPHSDITESQGIHGAETSSSKQKEETSIPSAVAQNKVKDSDVTASALQSDRQRSTHIAASVEKLVQSPDTPFREKRHPSQSGHDSPSIIRERVSKDGYNWRKYGQKNVKGNEFIRSYYKCTHPNCQAKKQLEQSNDGQITDSICIGQHNHPRPQSNITKPVGPVLPVLEEGLDKPRVANVEVEDKSLNEHASVPQQMKFSHSLQITNVPAADLMKAAHSQLTTANDEVHNNDYPDSKRQRIDDSNIEVSVADKSTCASRVVVQTSSEVDFVNDGYRWRKYGQKLVKGNANPRSYYRCSSPGCPVKKHVERASHDSKVVITTYEGQHDHEIPPGRTVTHNAATNAQTTTINGKPGTNSVSNPVSTDTRGSRSNEKVNGNSITKSEAGKSPESKLNGQQQQKNENAVAKQDYVGANITCQSNSEDPCRSKSNEQPKDDVETKSEGKNGSPNVVVVHDTPGQEGQLKKQSASDAEAV
ncbi:WRKY transcription factor 1 isoform X1 [Arachis ipaensis]|uniref:WRKY transcription factor 1 isoform X1 n=2 Tax=Arachis ipaensis TaxID=130454 RepID=UPI000A2AF5A3|nr:WRKY transcription factor 1 isoform X1 [Arachis ipaensis]XP_025667748.1 WRKY transcription factor 1 isoform X1 [Arachis hypogaea]